MGGKIEQALSLLDSFPLVLVTLMAVSADSHDVDSLLFTTALQELAHGMTGMAAPTWTINYRCWLQKASLEDKNIIINASIYIYMLNIF